MSLPVPSKPARCELLGKRIAGQWGRLAFGNRLNENRLSEAGYAQKISSTLEHSA